jgi:hypothetical protein
VSDAWLHLVTKAAFVVPFGGVPKEADLFCWLPLDKLTVQTIASSEVCGIVYSGLVLLK